MKLIIRKSVKEEQLINQCRKGKESAQRAVYEKYADTMMGVCIRYLKDRDAAQDVLMTAFMKVFERIHQFRDEGSFEGWIRRIMVNESLSYLRKYQNMTVEVDIERAGREPDYNSLSDHLETADIINMIEALPIGYRTVFNLYAIEGYSHKEIAEQLGISENTSKSQLSRARSYLQQLLLNAENVGTEKKMIYESY